MSDLRSWAMNRSTGTVSGGDLRCGGAFFYLCPNSFIVSSVTGKDSSKHINHGVLEGIATPIQAEKGPMSLTWGLWFFKQLPLAIQRNLRYYGVLNTANWGWPQAFVTQPPRIELIASASSSGVRLDAGPWLLTCI